MGNQEGNSEKSQNSMKGGEIIMQNYDDSPYILHPSDHLGLVFVTTPSTRENFASWKNSMETALYAKSKGGFIDGSLQLPKIDSSDFGRWKMSDAMPTPQFNKIFSLPLQEEQQFLMQKNTDQPSTIEGVAFTTKLNGDEKNYSNRGQNSANRFKKKYPPNWKINQQNRGSNGKGALRQRQGYKNIATTGSRSSSPGEQQ
ncbi:conserved hypothetical protein [Ricinus communis]|uniref:Retrotransposon Copia-like N-terminal domain-containing protein n=1 Tax=Ricinus communis TaxID=3988 RepID=B9S242_RICCO|nr:conserved hypothetical protein [Ricinus communis]